MKRKPIDIDFNNYPEELQPYLENAGIYDSSCSPEAKVIYIDKDGGLYLKNAPKGALKNESEMTAFFANKRLSARVLEYVSFDSDWLLTEKIPGEDCIFPKYLDSPQKLCDTIAILLRELHETDFSGCPVPNRTREYLKTAETNYRKGVFDKSYLMSEVSDLDAREAYEYILASKHLLKNDTLIHGDYCLPNIILDDFKFSGFIDLGGGGVGDRHIDLFWGAWTLNFNLKTEKYRSRFFDAYGRDKIDHEILKLISVIETFG